MKDPVIQDSGIESRGVGDEEQNIQLQSTCNVQQEKDIIKIIIKGRNWVELPFEKLNWRHLVDGRLGIFQISNQFIRPTLFPIRITTKNNQQNYVEIFL